MIRPGPAEWLADPNIQFGLLHLCEIHFQKFMPLRSIGREFARFVPGFFCWVERYIVPDLALRRIKTPLVLVI